MTQTKVKSVTSERKLARGKFDQGTKSPALKNNHEADEGDKI